MGKFVWQIEELSYEELQGWYAYFEKRPAGWRDDDRASKIIQAQGVKEKPWKLFPSLEKIYKPQIDAENPELTAGASLLRSAFMQQLMQAQGGDKVTL